MNPREIATLVNILGFLIGGVLYAMLLTMVLRESRRFCGRSAGPLLEYRCARSLRGA